MSTDSNYHYEFYAPWPALGKRFSAQLGEIRQDTEALVPVVRFSATYDKNPNDIELSKLRGWEYGDRVFHNRFRTISDIDFKWKIQANTGTEQEPFWHTIFSVGQDLSVDTSSFYIPSQIRFVETDGSPSITSATVYFNSSTFYITRNSHGFPIINLFDLDVRSGDKNFFPIKRISFDPAGFYVEADSQGQPVVSAKASSGGTGSVTFTDGVFTKTASKLSFNRTNFYLMPDSAGNPVVNFQGSSGGITSVAVTDGLNTYNTDTIRFSDHDFYLSRGTGGKPVVNLMPISGISGVGSKTFNFTASKQWTATHNLNQTPVIAQIYDNGYRKILPHEQDVSDPNVTYFYFTEDTAGHAIIETGVGGSGVTFTDGVVTKTGSKLSFNRTDFYLTPDSANNPVLNFKGTGGGSGTITSVNAGTNINISGPATAPVVNVNNSVALTGTLDVAGQVTFDNAVNATNNIKINAGTSTQQESSISLGNQGTYNWKLSRNADGNFSIQDQDAGGIAVLTVENGALVNQVRLVSGGNVGIGTASPSARLHVNGDFRAKTVMTGGFYAARADITVGRLDRLFVNKSGRVLKGFYVNDGLDAKTLNVNGKWQLAAPNDNLFINDLKRSQSSLSPITVQGTNTAFPTFPDYRVGINQVSPSAVLEIADYQSTDSMLLLNDVNALQAKISFQSGGVTFSQFGVDSDGLFAIWGVFGTRKMMLFDVSAPTQNIIGIDALANVGIGIGLDTGGGQNQNDTSAKFQINSTNRGFLPPRMTNTQKNAIASPSTGLVVYNTTANKLQNRSSGVWTDLNNTIEFPAGTTASAVASAFLNIHGVTGTSTIGYVAPTRGSFVAASVSYNVAVDTGNGTINFTPTINGSNSCLLQANITSTGDKKIWATFYPGKYTFIPGDVISPKLNFGTFVGTITNVVFNAYACEDF